MNLLNKGKNLLTDAVKGKVTIDTFTVYTELTELEAEYAYKKALSLKTIDGTNLFIPDEYVKVIKESENTYDPEALAIYAFNVKIGYLYQTDRQEYYSFKTVERMYIRAYFFNEKPRFELIIVHRSK